MGNDFDDPEDRRSGGFNLIKDFQRQAKERRKREQQEQKRLREIQKERLRQEKENMRKRMELIKEENRQKKELLKENLRRQKEIKLQNRIIDNLNQRRPRIQSAYQPMIFGNQRREENNNTGGFLFNIFNNIDNNIDNNTDNNYFNNNNNYINNNNDNNFNIFNNYNNNNNNNFNIFNNSDNILNNNNNENENEDKEEDNKIINMLEEIELTQIIIDKAETKECPICLIEYSINNKICYLPCFHFFHSKCIKNWCQKSKRCPLCNVDIKFE